ncbi:MAG: ATP-dependent RecD-like DNA helicase [Actinobacteria bacterium]|nr:ATP-dependent RecD-like DNA helicase [Actinomycetota bacterium]
MDESKSTKLKGTVERIVYRNPDNDYIIARFKSEESQEMITIVGQSIDTQPGERLEVRGRWVFNKKYGNQFEIETIEILIPATEEGIEKYLGSGLIKGIGPAMAKKIVSKFKSDTLKILDESPGKLSKIAGFGSKRIELIKNEWQKQKDIRNVMIFMQSYGISNNCSARIYNIYGKEAINVIRSNPYKLIEDVLGIGFKTADKISYNLGIERDSIFRIKSGILYLLNEITDAGNCYYPLDELINIAANLLEVEILQIEKGLSILEAEKRIEIIDKNAAKRVYLKNIYEDEKYVCEKLKQLKDFKGKDETEILKLSDSELTDEIERISLENGLELDEIQTDAVKKSITEKILIITGSPGTGKSTILNIVIKFFQQQNKKVLAAAPTGRASKRLSQTTSIEAKTIHRLLKYQPKMNKFFKNEQDQLDADLVIVDEASMLDIRLFQNFLKAIKNETNLILVGDIDQLPAVGPGNVLSDIINSNIFSVVRLQRIYRQEGKSQIIFNAHRIRDGVFPVLKKSEYEDFYFIEKIEPEQVVNMILDLITQKLPNRFNYNLLHDIQVLVPTNKGIVGVNNLNIKIQETINKNKINIFKGSTEYKINDKVIQLKNNYEKDVYNGDIGFIKNINFDLKELYIDFDGKIVAYDSYDLDEISLSYAISVHKAQGSEFKCVIIPILTSHYMLLQRNLLYTAITRAKEVVILIGSKKAIGMAVNKNIVEKRYTGLQELLQTKN